MTGRIQTNRHDPEAGVSEVVGAIMLISVVVVAVGVIAMVLFSQATPEKIPNVNFMVGSNYPPTMLYLYHNGGDNLRVGDFEVRLDGVSQPYALEGGGEDWSIGKRLNVDISTMAYVPRQVTLVYNSTGGGAVAIHSASANFSARPGSVSPDVVVTPTPSPTPVPPGSQAINEVFYRLSNAGIKKGSAAADMSQYFLFDMTSTSGSWITVQPPTRTLSLANGNRLKITLQNNSADISMFGLDDKLWNLTVSGVNVSIYYPGSPGAWVFVTNGTNNLVDGWINGCRDSGSTATIQTTGAGKIQTTLVINGTKRIQGFDNNNILIMQVHPVNPGVFTLQETTSSGFIRFLGYAESTKANGIECNSTACVGLP